MLKVEIELQYKQAVKTFQDTIILQNKFQIEKKAKIKYFP